MLYTELLHCRFMQTIFVKTAQPASIFHPLNTRRKTCLFSLTQNQHFNGTNSIFTTAQCHSMTAQVVFVGPIELRRTEILIYCSKCFSVDLAVVCLGLVIRYKSVT